MEDKKIEISSYEWSLNVDDQVGEWTDELVDKIYSHINSIYGDEFEDGSCFGFELKDLYPEFFSYVSNAISDCLDSRIVFTSDDD